MLGQVTNGLLASAERGIHDLPMFSGYVAALPFGDLADKARQTIALGLDGELIRQFEQARRSAMGDQRTVEMMMSLLHREYIRRFRFAGNQQLPPNLQA